MEDFKIYSVFRMGIKSGKGSEAAKWWHEKGKPIYEAMPGVKSVKAYAVQFSFGGNFVEVWLELENYAALDRIDEDLDADPQKYAGWAEFSDLFEAKPARIMGDWPESFWSPPSE